MQRLEVSGAVRPIYESLGVKRLISYALPTQCIYVFCMDLRKNSDYIPIQHKLIGFYSRVAVCLLRGTGWVFKYNSG